MSTNTPSVSCSGSGATMSASRAIVFALDTSRVCQATLHFPQSLDQVIQNLRTIDDRLRYLATQVICPPHASSHVSSSMFPFIFMLSLSFLLCNLQPQYLYVQPPASISFFSCRQSPKAICYQRCPTRHTAAASPKMKWPYLKKKFRCCRCCSSCLLMRRVGSNSVVVVVAR